MRADNSRTGRKKTEESSMAASGVEREVGLVAVRELARAQLLPGLDAIVEFFGDRLHLIRVEVLPVAALDDRRQRLRVFGRRLRPGGRRLRGVGSDRRGGALRGLRDRARRGAESREPG